METHRKSRSYTSTKISTNHFYDSIRRRHWMKPNRDVFEKEARNRKAQIRTRKIYHSIYRVRVHWQKRLKCASTSGSSFLRKRCLWVEPAKHWITYSFILQYQHNLTEAAHRSQPKNTACLLIWFTHANSHTGCNTSGQCDARYQEQPSKHFSVFVDCIKVLKVSFWSVIRCTLFFICTDVKCAIGNRLILLLTIPCISVYRQNHAIFQSNNRVVAAACM